MEKVRISGMMTLGGDSPFTFAFDSCGLFTTDDPWIHSFRRIESFEIVFVVAGEVYLQEEEARYPLVRGDILLLHAGRTHGGYRPSAGRTSFYWAHFATSDFAALGLGAPHLSNPENVRFTGMFKQLVHAANSSHYPGYACDLLLLSILTEAAVVRKESLTPSSKLIQDVSEWVRIHWDRPLTVAEVARHFTYSPDHLSELFRQSFGMGLKQYINDQKMKAARHLLLTTDEPIRQVAERLGFDSENRFLHYFRYHESQSPSGYRNLHHHTHLNKS